MALLRASSSSPSSHFRSGWRLVLLGLSFALMAASLQGSDGGKQRAYVPHDDQVSRAPTTLAVLVDGDGIPFEICPSFKNIYPIDRKECKADSGWNQQYRDACGYYRLAPYCVAANPAVLCCCTPGAVKKHRASKVRRNVRVARDSCLPPYIKRNPWQKRKYSGLIEMLKDARDDLRSAGRSQDKARRRAVQSKRKGTLRDDEAVSALEIAEDDMDSRSTEDGAEISEHVQQSDPMDLVAERPHEAGTRRCSGLTSAECHAEGAEEDEDDLSEP